MSHFDPRDNADPIRRSMLQSSHASFAKSIIICHQAQQLQLRHGYIILGLDKRSKHPLRQGLGTKDRVKSNGETYNLARWAKACRTLLSSMQKWCMNKNSALREIQYHSMNQSPDRKLIIIIQLHLARNDNSISL